MFFRIVYGFGAIVIQTKHAVQKRLIRGNLCNKSCRFPKKREAGNRGCPVSRLLLQEDVFLPVLGDLVLRQHPLENGPALAGADSQHPGNVLAVGLQPGEFVHTLGDTHLYLNHLEQVDEQLAREPRPLPVMRLNPAVKSLFDFRYGDFTLEGYDPWPAIKAPMSF